MKELHARGMVVQEGFGFFFDSALAAQPDLRDAGSTEDSAAEAAESTQAAMRKNNWNSATRTYSGAGIGRFRSQAAFLLNNGCTMGGMKEGRDRSG